MMNHALVKEGKEERGMDEKRAGGVSFLIRELEECVILV